MNAPNAPASVPPPAPARLVSIDALRGFTMIWIVGADALADAFRGLDGGAVSAWLGVQLGHAAWEGLTFYDLIFPLFLFIVGVAVPLSLDRIVEREGRSAALRRVLVRGLVMYTLGVLYYGGISHGWDQIRWVGVLQRLAAGYVAAALLHLWCRPRTTVAVGVTLLIGYWVLLTFVPVPGVGAGDYARGRNLANWVDAHWLPGKVWYGDYDPEGLLSTLPALVSALLGLAAARVVRDDHRSAAGRLRLLVVVGAVVLGLGYLWGLQFPICKRIWTSSYVLVTGGWSFLLLALFHGLIDVRGWRGWATPFVWVGSNALLIYFVSRVVDFRAVSSFFVGGEVAAALNATWTGLGALVLAVTSVVLCVTLCGALYRKKVFLRI
jgi:predicted acyltransferase